jgi:hypothetical protein
MSKTYFASLDLGPSAVATRVAACPALPTGEPSHIHVQRPSRRAQSPAAAIVEQPMQMDELTLALDEAA